MISQQPIITKMEITWMIPSIDLPLSMPNPKHPTKVLTHTSTTGNGYLRINDTSVTSTEDNIILNSAENNWPGNSTTTTSHVALFIFKMLLKLFRKDEWITSSHFFSPNTTRYYLEDLRICKAAVWAIHVTLRYTVFLNLLLLLTASPFWNHSSLPFG